MAAVYTDNSEAGNPPCIDKDKRLSNILVTGKTGVGKSRLVTALVGRNGAEQDACKLSAYEAVIKDVAFKVWDSPGLQDGTSNEDQYIQDMKDKIKDIALMIYCIKMDDARFCDADKKAIRTLTDEFGKEVWNHAVVALTFANKVEDPDEEDDLEYFQFQLQEWEKQVKEYFLSIGMDPEVCIPVIPTGSLKKTSLPDRENWLVDLRTECDQVMKASGKRAMYRIDRQRAMKTSASQNTRDDRAYDSHEQGTEHSTKKQTVARWWWWCRIL